MKYDDFPILDNTTYQILQEQYTNQQPDRHKLIGKIFNKLNMLSTCELLNLKHFNKSILSSTENSKSTISEIIKNFCQTFTIEPNTNNHIKTINIFSFLYEMLDTINLIEHLIEVNTKAYYKTFLNQLISTLQQSISTILSSLQHSTIHFFKYM